MHRRLLLFFIRELGRPVFTTQELSAISGKSPSSVVQSLNLLERDGLVLKIYRGIWADVGNKKLSPYAVIPFLLPTQRSYVSFISALHLHGIIEQIPQEINLASTAHTKRIKTRLGWFSIHRIVPSFFKGFDWYKGRGDFLIAEPEKALVDCLYLSACKKKQFQHFPEMHFPHSFSFKKMESWIEEIQDIRIRSYVRNLSELKTIVKITKKREDV